jgi:hypothetical protein
LSIRGVHFLLLQREEAGTLLWGTFVLDRVLLTLQRGAEFSPGLIEFVGLALRPLGRSIMPPVGSIARWGHLVYMAGARHKAGPTRLLNQVEFIHQAVAALVAVALWVVHAKLPMTVRLAVSAGVPWLAVPLREQPRQKLSVA